MIKANSDDLQKLKELCPKGHLIIATSTYSGKRDIIGALSVLLINIIQKLLNPKYNNWKKYIAHVFCIFYKNNELWVGEMDLKENWRENPIIASNSFQKIKKGQLRIFNLGKITEEEFYKFLGYSRLVKYPLLGAISSFKLFWFLKIFRTKKSFKEKRHCGEIFVRYQPFFKYFKTTGKALLRKYNTHHPEAIDHYLSKNFDLKVVKIKNSKICWSL